MYLADLGADVVSVVAPGRKDLMNAFPPTITETGLGASTSWLGRNKRTIYLNLKKPQSVAAIKKMVREYNVVVEQFRPGVMKRMGLDYETLREENPSLIYCSITGYGQDGPLAMRPGHDINYMALSGNLLLLGDEDGKPVMPNFQLPDVAGGGLMTVIGLLSAAYYREKTGKGQYIDISMFDSVLPFTCIEGSGELAAKKYPGWKGKAMSGLSQGSAYDFFETSDGKYMSIGALEPKFFAGLCKGLGIDEWTDGKIVTEDPERVTSVLAEAFRKKTRDEWTEIFRNIDTCVEPVLTVTEMCENEHVLARNMVPEVPVPLSEGKTVQQLGTPVRLSESPVIYNHAAYPVGYHTAEVLSQLGYRGDEIADMSS